MAKSFNIDILKLCKFYIQVGEEWESGTFKVESGDEDIHTANERRLKVNEQCTPMSCLYRN